MAKQVEKPKEAPPAPSPPQPKPAAKKPRQVPPPRTNQKQFDPKDYEFDEEPEIVVPPQEPEEAEGEPGPEGEQGAQLTSTPAPPIKSPKQNHSPSVLRRALEVNLAQAEIDGMTPDELLNEVLYRQQQISAWQESERRNAPRGPLVSEPVAEEDNLGLDESIVDPSIAAAIKRLAKENKELRESLTKSEERDKVREAETRNERIDRAFASMPEYAHVYGKGNLGDLTPDEFDCRDIVLAKVVKDPSKGSLEQKIQKVARLLASKFGAAKAAPKAPEEPYEQPVAKPTNGSSYEDEELAKRRKIWNESTVAEPTSRKGAPEPKGLAKAKKTFLAGAAALGQSENQLSVAETDELPD